MLGFLAVLSRSCVSLLIAAAVLGAMPMRASADPVVAAAGDIACDPADASFNGGLGTASLCHEKSTSDLLVAGAFDAVLPLGDNQYESATLSNFQASYDPSWGRVKATTHPATGNHEGTTATSGGGYCSYFGAAAHCSASGNQGGAAFYSWDVGTWHMIALNSNCAAAGGCDVGSAQYTWLQKDLAAHPATCTLAYWHHPRFSSGGSNTFMQPIWKLLYDNGADLVLSGHVHNYERFAPMDGLGNLNSADGMREFVVGTGGRSLANFGPTIAPNSEVRNGSTYGVLKLTLHPTSYDWSFVHEAGKVFTDSGTSSCRGAAAGDSQAPTAPTGLTATATGPTQVNLSWNAATDNVGVTGYDVWRGPAGGTLTRIAGTTGTSFSDTTVTGGQSFDYQVFAHDAAGNLSPPSAKVTVTTPQGGGTTTSTFSPAADASVREASPSSNFGTSTSLNSDSGTGVAQESYLRFTVSGLGTSAVQSAKLRLFVPSDGTVDGPGVYGCTAAACATWTETGITWNNRPPRASTAVADVGAIAAGKVVEWDVTPLIAGDGTYTLVVGQTPTTDGVIFSSREATTNKPQLVVTTGTAAAADAQAPSAPTGLSAVAGGATRVDLSWTASTDNIAVSGYEVWRGPAGGTLAKIATTTGTATTFSDTTASAGQSYDYQVRARDAAGNVSGPSNTASVTTPAAPPPSTTLGPFRASHDASVKEASPTANFGTSTSLNSDSGTGVAMESYLRFTVSGVGTRTVKSAKLRLFVPSDGTADGPGVYACTDLACDSWTETSITWNTRPSRAVAATADVGAITAGNFVEWDVTPLITGDGTFTLVIGPTPTTDGVIFSSDEATTNQPQLVVTVG